MADVKITDLTAATAVVRTDLVEITHDPAGTPASQKATLTQAIVGAQLIGNMTPKISGRYLGPGSGYGPFSTSGRPAEALNPQFLAVIVPFDCTIDLIDINIKDTGSGRHAQFGCWTSDPTTGLPATVVIDSGSISVDTTGLKTVSGSWALTAGKYWVATLVDSSTSIEGPDSGQFSYDCGTSGTGNEYSLQTNSIAYPSGSLPNGPFTFGSVGFFRGTLVRMRLA